MNELLLVIILICILIFWYDTSTKREIAFRQSSKLAKQFNLQLLDESIHCTKITLVKTVNLPKIKRVYHFSVSSNNDDRMLCHLILIGSEMEGWFIPPYPQLN